MDRSKRSNVRQKVSTVVNHLQNVSSKWVFHHSLAAIFIIASFLFFIPPACAAFGTYGVDSSTLHLWHLDESAVPCIDSAPGGTNLTSRSGGATLGNASALASFTNCLSTLDGGQDQFGGNFSDAVLTARNMNNPAVVQYCDAATGAFTYEAVVHIEFDPTKNFGPAGGGNGRNTPFQILNADGNNNSQRIFQFRIDPIGFQAFTGDTSFNVMRLEFINLAQGGAVQNILAPIPTAGGDAIASNGWYHVAVTYSGTPGVAGDINFYWTLLDPNRTQATLIDGDETMSASLPGSASPTVFTVGNAGRNPNGTASNPLNANFPGRIDEVRISSVARTAEEMLFIPPGITITSQPSPTNQIVGTGQTVNYSVTAAGQPLNYQWRQDGSPLLDATNSTFTIASAQPSDSGNYDVLVTNNFYAATSIVVSVTVTNLAIITQPASVAAGNGGTAAFNVAAVGEQPISYQWRKNSSPISGATNDTLTLTSLTTAAVANYDVIVTNSFGSLASTIATLTVSGPQITLTPVFDGTNAASSGYAYAGSSGINTISFICSELMTVGDQQFFAYYGRHQTDPSYAFNNTIWVARRTVGTNDWQIFKTTFTANDITDGHDVVAFGIDGSNYLHMSWGVHDQPLKYARSLAPVTGTNAIVFSANLGTMIGQPSLEDEVTYPQFLTMPDGDLLFLYRVGESGGGDTYLNRWSLASQTWTNVNMSNGVPAQFIKGLWPTDYNAYPNMPCVDAAGNFYLGWTWRQTPAYESNQNLDFARSTNGGLTWLRYEGAPYDLPISQFGESGDPNTIGEIIESIPQNFSLINQAGMCLDASNNPVIATWWAPGSGTNNFRRQYMIVFPDTNGVWQTRQVSNRTNDPPGTMQLDGVVRDLGRPVVVCDKQNRIIVLYRDNFGSNGLTIVSSLPYAVDPQRTNWTTLDLTTDNLGGYEPVIDLARWKMDNVLDIVYQASDGEGYTDPGNTASPIGVLEWNAAAYFNHIPTLQLNLTNQNQDVALSWNSQPGWGYQVQWSTNLVNWNLAATLNGISGIFSLQYIQTNGVSGAQRFWRLQTQEGGFGP